MSGSKKVTCRIVWVLQLVLMLVSGISAQTDHVSLNPRKLQSRSGEEVRQREMTLRAVVAEGRLEDLRWPNFSEYRARVEDLYRHLNFKPVWLRAGQPTPQAGQMIAILQQADSAGLHAEDYDASQWQKRIALLEAKHTQSDEIVFDVGLTVCSMRYISDLREGVVNPRHFKFAFDVAPKELNLAAFVQTRLANGKNLKDEIAQIEPPLEGYARLRAALSKYIQLANEDNGEKLPMPHGIVFSGTPYEGVSRLARLLRLLGDLPEDTAIPADSQIYVEPLVEAVKHFQRRHGLRPDGYLDVDTITELNVPLSNRVEQMRFALERYRWLRYDFPQPPVIINIPGFRLYALDETGKVALTMTIDVGDDYTIPYPGSAEQYRVPGLPSLLGCAAGHSEK